MAEETSTEVSTEPEGGQAQAPAQGQEKPESTSNAPEQTQTTENSEPENWWDANGLDQPEKVEKRLKSIQADYTRKSQEISQLKQDADKAKLLEDNIRQTLLAPDYASRIEQARTQLMLQMGQTPNSNADAPPRPSKLETADDVMEYLKGPYAQWLEHRAEQKAVARFAPVTQRFYADVWKKSGAELQEKYPGVYDKYATKVLSDAGIIYPALSQKGYSESQVLETALWSIPEARDELLKTQRQEALRSVEAKKRSVTEKPKKSQPTSSDSQSRDDILAELRRSGFSFEVTQ